MSRRPSIHLHIKELVLHGFAPGDRHRIGDAVEMELRRLLEDRQSTGTVQESSDTDRVDAGEFKVTSGATPQTIGGHVAASVHRSLIPPNDPPQTRT
jgi:hypothetical protein